MEPLSITAASLSIAVAITKTTFAIVEFSHQAKDAAEDLLGVSRELQALAAIVDPLMRYISRAPKGTVTADQSKQLQSSLNGCAAVIARIDSTIDKYQKDGGWTKTKWVLFGRGSMEKLRVSLEAYKMALSLGLQSVSMAVADTIKDDTGAIRGDTQALRNDVTTVQVNTEEILARVASLQNGSRAGGGGRTIQWVENMAVLSSYAESTYQETVIGAGEEREVTWGVVEGDVETIRGGHADPVPGSELYPLEEEARATRAGKGSPMRGLSPVTSEPQPKRSLVFRLQRRNRSGSKSTKEEAPRTLSSLPTSTTSGENLESQQGINNGLHSMNFTISEGETKNQLDVVVALDLGETSAAVAWMTQNTPMQTIREWPAGDRPRLFRETDNVPIWRASRQGSQHREDQNHATPETLSYSVLFLRKLYVHVKRAIVPALGLKLSDWERLGVEFHVTAPDVFHASTQQVLTRRLSELKSQLREAGIGTGGPRHYAVIGPTETEAIATAMVHHTPALISPSRSLMVKIGITHATVFLVDRPSEGGSSICAHNTVAAPELSFLIERAVCQLLEEDHPEAWEKLGSAGPGPVAQTGQYRDFVGVLCGGDPQHESYRLRFDGLPRQFTDRASGIRNGSIKFNRRRTEQLFNLLVDRITETTKVALVSVLRNAALSSSDASQIFQDAVILEAPDTPKRLKEGVLNSLELESKTMFARFVTADEKDGKIAPYESALRQDVRLGTSAAPLPALLDGDLAAVKGLLLNRNPWNFAHTSRLECKARGLVWLYARNRRAYDPDTYLRREEPGREWRNRAQPDRWLSPTVTQRWKISDYLRFDRHRIHKIDLDFYFTFDGNEDGERLETHQRLCTVVWELETSHFDYVSYRQGWRCRRVHRGSLDFTLQFDLLLPSEMGPRFTLHLEDGSSLLPISVEWHREPPFAVWPTTKGDKE